MPVVWTWIPPVDILKLAMPVLSTQPPASPSDGRDGAGTDVEQKPQLTPSRSQSVPGDTLNRRNDGTPPLQGTTMQQPAAAPARQAADPEGDDYPDLDILREDPRGMSPSNGAEKKQESPAGIPATDAPSPPTGEPDPVILLYHTHNAENYGADDGASRFDGRNAGVFTAGKRLASRMQEKHKLRVFHSDVIHDYPSYDLAYAQSRKTLLEMLSRYPNPLAIIDLHRDAVPVRETVTIGGRKAARIMIVIGTDARAPHPHWKDNLHFAEAVAAKLEELAPGLCKGVVTKEGRYHQQMHPRALLVEIGGDRNSIAEAQVSAEIFADALTKVLREKGLLREAKKGT